MINDKRSEYLAGLDPTLTTYHQDLGLSWLDDVATTTAADRQRELLEVYANVKVGPAYDGNGELMPERQSIWIQHPPVADPIVPIFGSPPVPPTTPTPPPGAGSDGGTPGRPVQRRLGVSIFSLIPASSSWAQAALAFVLERGLTRIRVWGDWDRPSSASRMLAADGSVDAGMLATFVARGRAAAQGGATFNLTFGTGAGRYTSFAAQVSGISSIVTALAGEDWIDYIDVANEWTETMSPGQIAVLLEACRTADPSRKFSASISGSPSVVATNVAAIYALGQTLDVALPHFPRDGSWMHTGPRVASLAAILRAQQIVVPIGLEEENRMNVSGGYEPRSASEFYTAAGEGFQAGAVEFTVHTQAGFLPGNGSFESQLTKPIEPEVMNQIAARVANYLR